MQLEETHTVGRSSGGGGGGGGGGALTPNRSSYTYV